MAGFETTSHRKRVAGASWQPSSMSKHNVEKSIGPDPDIYISPTEPLVLHGLGIRSLLPEDHGMDILDMKSGTGIQRKTIQDLYASMNDGRLTKQINQHQNSPVIKHCVLLLEGNPFGLEIPLTDIQLSMVLLTIQRSGYYIIQSKNLTYTAAVIPRIVHHFRNGTHNLINRPPNIQSDWRLTMLQLLPGVGAVKAQRIMDNIGFPLVLKEEEEDRAKLKKVVGESTYGKIMQYFDKS